MRNWFTTDKKQTLTDILKKIVVLLEQSEASDWSPLTPQEVANNLEIQIENLEFNQPIDKDALVLEFLATSTIQEIAMANNWHNTYLKLSTKFDKIIAKF
ncbi:MAG: hypothetical protein ACWA5P_03055 [bacterium]